MHEQCVLGFLSAPMYEILSDKNVVHISCTVVLPR